MRRKAIIVGILVGAAFLLTFGHYTHRGYINVVDTEGPLRLLEHGFHLRAPWHDVTTYPIQCREVRVQVFEENPDVNIHFDGVLYVGIARDSVASLHRTYQGAYMEKVISPIISDFLRNQAEGYGLWEEDVASQRVTAVMLDLLGTEGGKYGINVPNMWLRSYEAERTTGPF
jgi:hypothetical protein